MSKIGKKPILIPQGVDIKIEGGLITAKGPKGELSRVIPEVLKAEMADGKLEIKPKDGGKEHSTAWGLHRALVHNIIIGVSNGFEETLEFQGVGYKAIAKGEDLELNLGYSHPIQFKNPGGITFKIEKNLLKIQGIDKELVGYVAAKIRSMREPEPYKGSGVRYSNEVIKLKPGKKAVAAG
ncbi:MAG: 50S ribosomal protein L6 [Candidatus Yanofskybacteria bacterium]|nr:50S ribosomal protein L6 [Candidatus Yanofskybacteria bacterium]